MNTDDLITVVSLANKLNVAKQTIFYHCNKLDIEAQKIENVSYLTHAEAEAITQRINKNKKDVSDNINKSAERVHIDTNQDVSTADPQANLVDVLLEQLKVKDEQIKQLNNTLDEQQRLLSQQQSLQLQSNDKIKALEIELQEVKEDTKQDTTDVPVKAEADRSNRDNKVDNFYRDLREDRNNKQSQSFLSRLFKR
ncbi:hypothetical protein ACMGE6_12460 (plasmid) [Macrococcus equi]|uniref:hypothetical protein n=1 Tax=Macrococcus equi TaxID=3395462 RepID=UPI0039BE3F5C